MDPAAAHLRPWRRWPYVLVLLAAAGVLLAWVIAAITMLANDVYYEAVCPLLCVGVVLIGIASPAAFWRRRGLSRAKTTLSRNEDALAALRSAHYTEAAATWDGLCRDSRHAPLLHALYVHNLGMAWLHLGKLDEARVLLDRARKSGWFGTVSLGHARPQIEVGHALCLALSGEGEAARAQLDALRPTLSDARRPVTMLADAVIAARAGREVAFDEEALRSAEASLMPAHIRALRLLEAYAHRAGGGAAYRRGADAPGVDSIGIRPGELDFLASKWPELRSFMGERGLLGT